MKKSFDFASIDADCQAESHRVLSLYVRYILKKFKIRKYNHYIFNNCPRYEDYYLHINGLILCARRNSYYNSNLLIYPSSKCKEIDIIVKRYIFRKYNIKLYYDDKKEIRKNLFYKNFKLNFFIFIKDVVTDLRARKFVPIQNKNNNNIKKSTVLIISHNYEFGLKAYYNLPEKLTNFFASQNKNINIILPYNIGLSIFDKTNNSFKIIYKLIKYSLSKLLKLSDFHFIILDSYNQIYKNKIKNYYKKNNINLIICSFINSRYEPFYYEAAKELNIKYCTYDYSLGYPMKDFIYSRYLPDTRKFSDIIFSNSIFRSNQYFNSSKFLHNQPKILPHICPQSDYSFKIKKSYQKKSSRVIIGIVDNIYYDDCSINYNDIITLLKSLTKNCFDLEFILQSKKGNLEKEFLKLNKNKKFSSGIKGDFSQLKNADLIISIGWQSTALKAASIFKKPLIFYSGSDYPYSNHNFSIDKYKNKKMQELCNQLWFCEKKFKYRFNLIIRDEIEFKLIDDLSKKFLFELGFFQNNLEGYFRKYF